MTTLAESFDALLLDLDGTVYLGGQPIDHVAPALTRAAQQGARSVFVTNNASRPPTEVATSLSGMGIPAGPADVLTSPQAAARMLTDRHAAGTKVLVVGSPWLAECISQAGLQAVTLAADEPEAVVQGLSMDIGWRELAEACIAIRAGADWVACNVDSTLPTDRGLLPGNGALVAALTAATGLTPRVAGKPKSPLLDAAVELLDAQRPLVVGDRMDTDIACAVAGKAPSLLVFTGVSTPADLLIAVPDERPTYLAFDLRGLVEEDRAVRIPAAEASASTLEWSVTQDSQILTLAASGQHGDGAPSDAAVLRALALLTARAWATGATTVRSQDRAAAAVLSRCGLAEPSGTPA